MPSAPLPTQLRKEGTEGLAIDWDDGRAGVVAWRALREACPCAGCKEQRNQPPNPFRVLSDKEIGAGPPRPVSLAPIGRYAYKIVWNDGHDSGIYPLELLYKLTTEGSAL